MVIMYVYVYISKWVIEGSYTADRSDYLMLIRKYVSRKAAGKGRAVLEGVGLDLAQIDRCFEDNRGYEEAVQAGLGVWSGGHSRKQSTWEVLLAAMEYAEIATQHIQDLKQKLNL